MLLRNTLKNNSQKDTSHSLKWRESNREGWKTIIIHPADATTTFLTEIYNGRPAMYGVEGRDIYRERIERAERTLLFGHGFPQGLIGEGKIIIDDSFGDLFRNQLNNIYVFCNADCYVWRNDLQGFATGMFISEPIEAQIFNVDATAPEIEASNALFSRLMREVIDRTPLEILDYMETNYHIPGNAAVEYNRNGFRVFE